jgi:hypothetical protein
MTKWITTDDGIKCILMINNLLENKEPRNILRQAWQMCDDFYKFTKREKKDDGEIEIYKKKHMLQIKYIENLQDKAQELKRSVNTTLNVIKNMDNDLIEMLTNISDELQSEKFNLNNKIKEWWNNNIEYVNDENIITSTEIWNKFKKNNKELIGENNITIENFKDIVTSSIVNSSTYIEKSKKSAIEFIGFKWKEIKLQEIDNLEVENIILKKVKTKIK